MKEEIGDKDPWGVSGVYIAPHVFLNKKLTSTEKILFGIIDRLTNNDRGFCWASNAYLARLIDVTPSTTSDMVSKLRKMGYLNTEQIFVTDEAGNKKTQRKIFVDGSYMQKYKHLIKETLGEINLQDVDMSCDIRGTEDDVPGTGGSLRGVPEDRYTGYRRIATNSRIVDSRIVDITLKNKQKDELISGESGYPDKEKPKLKRKIPVMTEEQMAVQKYNEFCPSLPKIIKLTPGRKTSINARLKEYGLEDVLEVFRKAEASDFLSNRNQVWKGCSIDWLMKPSNFIKVLEGNYDNADGSSSDPVGMSSDEFINQSITDGILRKSFKSTCFNPAIELLSLSSDDHFKLAKQLLTLKADIERIQASSLAINDRELFPGSLALIRGYITYLTSSDWITNFSIKVFAIEHPLFGRYRREQAKEDNLERDPLTSKSYMRE